MSNAHATAHGHEAPPHGHDAHGGHEAHGDHGDGHAHGHGAANNGPVVAVVVILALVLLAAKTGLVVPTSARRAAEMTRQPTSGERGTVVLKDGRSFKGTLRLDATTVRVDTKDEQGRESQLVFDRTAVRVETEADRPAGGIVVLTSGKVLVGRVTSDATSVTVHWPYGEQTFAGEVVVPRDKVRYVDASHDTLGDDYWRQNGDAPIDRAFRRDPANGGAPRDDRSSRAPAGPASPRTQATLAQTRGEWQEAATHWATVYGETHAASDLQNLLHCAGKYRDDHIQRENPEEAFVFIKGLLSSFGSVPEVRTLLGDTYQLGARYHIQYHHFADAERWVATLRALGGEYVEMADGFTRAIQAVREEAEREEAEEHQGGHPG